MWMCPFPFPSQPGRRTFPSTPTCVYPRWQVLPPHSQVAAGNPLLKCMSMSSWRFQASNSLFLSLLGCSPKYLHFLPPHPAVTCCHCTLHLGSRLVSEGLIPKHRKVLGNLHCSSGISCCSSSTRSSQLLWGLLGVSVTAPWQGCSIPGKFLPQWLC